MLVSKVRKKMAFENCVHHFKFLSQSEIEMEFCVIKIYNKEMLIKYVSLCEVVKRGWDGSSSHWPYPKLVKGDRDR